MRILVTGAAGTLGGALLPRLTSAGHHVAAFDIAVDLARNAGARGGGADVQWVLGDVRDLEAVRAATSGVDIVIHAAALHGIHLRDHAPREFHDLNVTGTFNVWEAAVANAVRGVVFSSTMGVYGESRIPAGDDAIAILDEDRAVRPGDVYGWTKVAGEELCRYQLRAHAIPSVALRFGMFVPEPFFRYGIRLLYGGVHESDAADAVMAALRALERGSVMHEVANVEAPLPFTAADGPDLRRDPLNALERHFPGSAELLRSRGVSSLRPVTEVFPTHRLEERLGFRPRHDFGEWLAELRERPEENASSSPPWP